jgi:hypothetical protein
VNGDFEDDLIDPWTLYVDNPYSYIEVVRPPYVRPNDYDVSVASNTSNNCALGNYVLKVFSTYNPQASPPRVGNVEFYQILNTTAGLTYQISFEYQKSGGSGNAYYIYVGDTEVASGDAEFGYYWQEISTTFIAAGGNSDVLDFFATSNTYASAHWFFDNFQVYPVSCGSTFTAE